MKHFNFTAIEGNLDCDPIQHPKGSNEEVGMVELRVRCGREGNELFAPVRIHNKLAEVAVKYLKQGSRVLVSGTLNQDSAGLYITGSEINFLSPRSES